VNLTGNFTNHIVNTTPRTICIYDAATYRFWVYIAARLVCTLQYTSVVNKDLSIKAKAENLTSEHIQGPL